VARPRKIRPLIASDIAALSRDQNFAPLVVQSYCCTIGADEATVGACWPTSEPIKVVTISRNTVKEYLDACIVNPLLVTPCSKYTKNLRHPTANTHSKKALVHRYTIRMSSALPAFARTSCRFAQVIRLLIPSTNLATTCFSNRHSRSPQLEAAMTRNASSVLVFHSHAGFPFFLVLHVDGSKEPPPSRTSTSRPRTNQSTSFNTSSPLD